MTNNLKDILIRGFNYNPKTKADFIVFKKFDQFCKESQSDFIAISYNPYNSTLKITLDMANEPDITDVINVYIIVDGISVIIKKDFMGDENSIRGIHNFYYKFSEDMLSPVGSDIRIAVSDSEKKRGCIFDYRVVFKHDDLSVVADNDSVYHLNFIQNQESTIPVLFDETEYTVKWSFNNVEYPAGTAITNARARMLTSLGSGHVVATINDVLNIVSDTILVDQSRRSIRVEQQNVINGIYKYINFYTTKETNLPSFVNYYLNGVILNDSHMVYDDSIVGSKITAVLRPAGQDAVTLLDDVISDIELFYDYSDFIIQESNIDNDYLSFGYNSIFDNKIFNSLYGSSSGVEVKRHDDFVIGNILNYTVPDLNIDKIEHFRPVILGEPVIWEEISNSTGKVLSVKSMDRYNREQRESMNQLTCKVKEIFNDEHRYKYDFLYKYTDDSVMRFNGVNESLVDFRDGILLPKTSNDGDILMTKNMESGIIAISGIINFQGNSYDRKSKVLVEIYRDAILIERFGFRRVGSMTEFSTRTNTLVHITDDNDSRAFNFDYRNLQDKPNNIKIHMNQKGNNIFSLSEFQIIGRF